MFTGLVDCKAAVAQVVDAPPGKRLVIEAAEIAADAALGDSISVSGCCLTVVAIEGGLLAFEAGPETLRLTTLGQLAPGGEVNLERSLRLGDRMGGHLVTGHVDGVGRVESRADDQEWSTFWISAPPALMRQMATKGSITVAGVSLTLNEVTADRFSVGLIPHTLEVTTLGNLQQGDAVNLETDLLAKYVERQLAGE